jgi:hypothetical protein
MKLLWANTPDEIRKILEQSLLERGNDFRSRAISDFLKGSCGMKYPWHKNNGIKTIVYNGITSWYNDHSRTPPDSETVSNIISSFGEMKLQYYRTFGELTMEWIDLPMSVKKCFYMGIQQNSSRFTSQEISKILLR